MAKYETIIQGDFKQIVKTIEQHIKTTGISMQLVDESNYTLGEAVVAIRVYDKYYARNANRASLSITMSGYNGKVYITAIGSGGGQGVFMNFSFGAEDNMVNIVKTAVEKFEYQ